MADLTEAQLLEIRVLIPDDVAPYAFSDEQLNAIFSGSGNSSIMRTVGWASFALGGGALLVDGIKNDEIATNTSKAASEWRERARFFWGKADDEDGVEEYFDLITPGPTFCGTPELAPRDSGWSRW